jgi:hypothetical protein
MRILLSYPTEIGIFDIGQCEERKYHPIFNDESLGSYASIQEAVDNLVANKTVTIIHFETKEKIDTSKLDIPQDYTQWDCAY